MLTILEGDTFCLSDAVGDITDNTHGLFANDTRMLSRLRLLVDGASPLLLTSRAVEYFTAAHPVREREDDDYLKAVTRYRIKSGACGAAGPALASASGLGGPRPTRAGPVDAGHR